MTDHCSYRIILRWLVSESDLADTGPLAVTIEPAKPGETLLILCTDQSGLVGFMRHLHGLGFIVQSIIRLEIEGGKA
jgi:hypothetical protein